MTTGRQLITAALRKLGANSANAVPTAEDMDVGLEALNTLIDSKSNSLLNIHTITPKRFQLTAGRYVYALGPTGDWVTERPMRVEKTRLIMNPILADGGACAYPLTGDAPLTVYFASPCPGLPTASFDVLQDLSDARICFFTYTGTGGVGFLWDFGDGTTSTEENPAHTFAGGNYTVTLTVINAAGEATVSQVIDANYYFMSFVFYIFFTSLAFQTELLNWLHTHSPYLDPLNYGQGYNLSFDPAGANLLGDTIVKVLDWSVPNAVVGSRLMGPASAYGICYQNEIYQPQPTSRKYFYGYWPGGSFNPNIAYGGSNSTAIESDGVTSWIIQPGGGGATGLTPFTLGDFVTCIYVPDTSLVNFFVNENWVGAGVIANGNGYALAGSNP